MYGLINANLIQMLFTLNKLILYSFYNVKNFSFYILFAPLFYFDFKGTFTDYTCSATIEQCWQRQSSDWWTISQGQ